MRSFCKLAVLAAFLFSNVTAGWAETPPEKKEATPKKESVKEEKKEKLTFPVPVGHDSKGLKLPSYGPDGKLQMVFNIGVATRISDQDVNMAELSVQTYDDAGAPEMHIDLPVSRYNLATRVLSTQQKVKITREDFELTGNTMEFDTETRSGKLGGGVKMIIFNLDAAASGEPDAAGEKNADAVPKVTFPKTDNQPTIKVTKPKPASPEAAPRE